MRAPVAIPFFPPISYPEDVELLEPAGVTAHPAGINLVELWRLGRGHGFELVGYTPDGNPLYNAQDGTGPYNLEGQVVEGA